MILPIKNTTDWELIRHQKKTQINKYNILKKFKRVDYDYKVRDILILNHKYAFKY